MNSDDIPKSWLACSLGSIVDYGKAAKAEPSEIPADGWILELEDIERDSSKLLSKVTFAERQSKSTKNRFDSGDVLYGKLRPYLNKVILAEEPGFCTTEILPLKPIEGVLSRYLFYWLKHHTFADYVEKVSHGLNMPRLGTEAGKKAPFILAPTNEQIRIVAKLDSLNKRVAETKNILLRMRNDIKRFRQTVLAAAAQGKLSVNWRAGNKGLSALDLLDHLKTYKSNLLKIKAIKSDLDFSEAADDFSGSLPASWTLTNLSSLCNKITDGEHATPRRTTTGFFLLSARNVTNEGLKLEDVDFVDETEFRKLRKRCDPNRGDILISCSGSVGRISTVDKDDHYVMVRSAAMIRPAPGFVDVEFLKYVLQSPFCQGQIEARSKSTAQANLFLGEMKQIIVPYPPLEEQSEIVRQVNRMFEKADLLDNIVVQALSQLDRVSASLLSKAFKGKLVLQDPSDVPAEKIILQSAGDASKKQKSRK
jgi:type I restriction enzyme, S subunit